MRCARVANGAAVSRTDAAGGAAASRRVDVAADAADENRAAVSRSARRATTVTSARTPCKKERISNTVSLAPRPAEERGRSGLPSADRLRMALQSFLPSPSGGAPNLVGAACACAHPSPSYAYSTDDSCSSHSCGCEGTEGPGEDDEDVAEMRTAGRGEGREACQMVRSKPGGPVVATTSRQGQGRGVVQTWVWNVACFFVKWSSWLERKKSDVANGKCARFGPQHKNGQPRARGGGHVWAFSLTLTFAIGVCIRGTAREAGKRKRAARREGTMCDWSHPGELLLLGRVEQWACGQRRADLLASPQRDMWAIALHAVCGPGQGCNERGSPRRLALPQDGLQEA
eukprot:scaffold48950_cov28-Tisochrysis_lutea.AAC.2